MSWIIIDNATDRAVCEVYERPTPEQLGDKYTAETVMEYLGKLNERIRNGEET